MNNPNWSTTDQIINVTTGQRYSKEPELSGNSFRNAGLAFYFCTERCPAGGWGFLIPYSAILDLPICYFYSHVVPIDGVMPVYHWCAAVLSLWGCTAACNKRQKVPGFSPYLQKYHLQFNLSFVSNKTLKIKKSKNTTRKRSFYDTKKIRRSSAK